MTKAEVEVITSVPRRRRWSASEKERLVGASLEPGVGVSAVAREAGIHPSHAADQAHRVTGAFTCNQPSLIFSRLSV